MNKLLRFFTICLLAAACLTVNAQNDDEDARLRQKMQAAVMKVYDDHLAQNPDDYNTRFARANQLYYNGEYARALEDARIVEQQIPTKEKEVRLENLLLIARILDYNGNYEDEIETLRTAADIDPKSLACIDLLGKVSLKVKDLSAAEHNFQTILRESPMNYDAMYQMAKVELARNNYAKAAGYVDKAVELFKAEPQVYINRSDILFQMEQYEPAVQDLISAMSVGDDGGVSIQKLFEISDTRYDDVMNVLATSIDKAPQVGMFYYVRANIAMRHEHYAQALKNLRAINDYNLYNYHSIDYATARCHFELTQYDDAALLIDRAISKAEGVMPDYLILKAQIERYRTGKVDQALTIVDQALAAQPGYAPAMLTKARLQIQKRADRDALATLSTLLAAEPDNAEALLLRGWVNKYRLSNPTGAAADFETILLGNKGIEGLQGFALHELNRDEEARTWAKQIIKDGILPGGKSYFIASALLSDIGNFEAGDKSLSLEYLRSALANGYGSLQEVKVNEDPYVNLKLVRRYEDFNTVLDQNTDNFKERR